MKIKNYLKKLRIKFKEFKHPQVYTIEQAKKYCKSIKGLHSKILFLKDKKSKSFYLFIIPEDKQLDISKMEEQTLNKLKFANENNLKKILDLTYGAVSPFGLINDKDNVVYVLIDKKIWGADYVSFHPNINTETLELSGKDFQKYMKSLKNKFQII